MKTKYNPYLLSVSFHFLDFQTNKSIPIFFFFLVLNKTFPFKFNQKKAAFTRDGLLMVIVFGSILINRNKETKKERTLTKKVAGI